jgi:DNA-binding winged helix-turn-helix (wHTH) protein/Tol biopolymer transport system component
VYQFGPFQLDAVERVLQRSGQPVLITPKALEVLVALIKRRGHVVLKEDLMREVWPGTFVEPNNLAFNISLLRKALGEDGSAPDYIETVPKRGYRFIANVTELPASNGNLQTVVLPEAPATAATGSDRRFASLIRLLASALALVASLVIGAGIWMRGRPRAPAPELKVRELTTNTEDNPIQHAVISPDGKYLAYGDRAGIQIRLIDTGETHLLPRPESVSDGDLWFPAAWSADGSKVFATSITSKATAAWSLSVIGGGASLLRETALVRSVSPDGSMIAFLTDSNQSENAVNRHLIRGAEIWIMGPNGENARRVVAGNFLTYIGSVAWSQHGRRIAFQKFRRDARDSITYTIETVDLKGSTASIIFEKLHYGSYSVDRNFPEDLCWLSDGRIVYAVREPMPTIRDSNLWTVKVDESNGQRRGEPARMTKLPGFHMEALSAAADGKRMLFESSSDQSYVYVARLSSDNRLSEGRRITPDERYNTPFAWTADGKAVIFRSDRSGRFALYKQALNRQVPDLIPTGPGSPGYPRLSPDGNWVIYPNGDYPKTDRLMRVPLAGGPPQVVLEHVFLEYFDCPRRPGLPCLFVQQSSDGKQDIFWNFDPHTGSRSEGFRTPRETTSMVVSPDGSLISTISTRSPGVIQVRLRSGELKRTIRIDGWPDPSNQDWGADGKSLFVSHPGLMQSPGGPIGATVLHVDFDGHAQPIWEMRGGRYSFAIPSPDGEYIAIRGATNGRNAWLLENF